MWILFAPSKHPLETQESKEFSTSYENVETGGLMKCRLYKNKPLDTENRVVVTRGEGVVGGRNG